MLIRLPTITKGAEQGAIVILMWKRAEPRDQLDVSLPSVLVDWIRSVMNRLLKPPTHAAISHAFEAVQRSAIDGCTSCADCRPPFSTGVNPSLAVCFPNQGW